MPSARLCLTFTGNFSFSNCSSLKRVLVGGGEQGCKHMMFSKHQANLAYPSPPILNHNFFL